MFRRVLVEFRGSSSGLAKLLSSYFGSFTEQELENEEDMHKMSFFTRAR